MDVLVAARPELRRKPADFPEANRGVHLNGDIDTRKDRVTYTVSVDTGGRRPSAAYVYDVETLRLGVSRVVLEKGAVKIATRSNWFMAVLCYGKSPVATALEAQDPLLRGKECAFRIWAFGPDGVLPAPEGRTLGASLRIPGLAIGTGPKGLPVRVPGEVTIRVPREARPGSYLCTLSGSGILGCMRFLEVR
jgi:hypothetical protein